MYRKVLKTPFSEEEEDDDELEHVDGWEWDVDPSGRLPPAGSKARKSARAAKKVHDTLPLYFIFFPAWCFCLLARLKVTCSFLGQC